MNFFKKLNPSLKVGILTFLISLVGFLATLFLLFNGYKDIPLGIIFSGTFIGLLNVLVGLMEKRDGDNERSVMSVVFIGIKFFLTMGMMIVIALMYYRWGLPYFNIFTYIGVYTISIAFTVIVYLKERS